MSERVDVLVVGAGILGLAVARELLARRPGRRAIVLKRAGAIATHQSRSIVRVDRTPVKNPALVPIHHSDMRRKTLPLLLSCLLIAIAAPLASAHGSKPVIKGEEVGYFGGATVTYQADVFVYSNLGPRSGTHVNVCMNGTCERAVGHTAKLAWYSAAFKIRGLRMGDPVKFSVVESNASGRATVTVTRPLLCMHNNGSTPQS